ncbi:MAG TPA: c-type cytochrome domain-containing protein [Verrucomicrobiae bacterium]|nr:c-type cytochrome domain-containing protein [Verrucomicrobiae bacterium]
MNLTTPVLLVASTFCYFAVAAEAPSLPPPASRQGVSFAKDILPVFEKSCVKCHSGERPKAKLRLDTLEGTLKGSSEGKVVVPGDSAKSQLVLTVGHQVDKDLWMPPPGNKQGIKPLAAEEISLIRAWIDQGAK